MNYCIDLCADSCIMKRLRIFKELFLVTACRALFIVLALGLASACSKNEPLSPASPSPSGPKLTAPTPDSPAEAAGVNSLRPTFVVRNGSSDQGGTRLYEFQVSDSSSFPQAAALSTFRAYAVLAHQTGVPEGSGGSTSYTPDFDLQPTTRLFWRARMVQGATPSDWSVTRSFTTPIMGYNRAGELYDPLVYGSTIGTPVGSTTFIPGRGIRLNDGNAYVRYQLQTPIGTGEFSMEIEGLSPNGPGPKLKVFSMSDGTGDVYRSQYLMVAQYRGLGGNPDNCIAFKMILGDPTYKLEPDLGTRFAAVMDLNPNQTYFWKATWGNFLRLFVTEGVNGRAIYNTGISITDLGFSPTTATYNPSPHFAYLGANNGPFGEEDGSFPGAVYRNVWIGRGPKPASLGSALAAR